MSTFDPPGTQRPVPVPTEVSAPFWNAARDGRLTYQRCIDCGHVWFPPELVCTSCLSRSVEWCDSAGLGTVYSFSIAHREPSPNFPVPSVFAVIDVDEGYAMFSSVVGCDPYDVTIGMRVEVVFQPVTDAISLPMFRPV